MKEVSMKVTSVEIKKGKAKNAPVLGKPSCLVLNADSLSDSLKAQLSDTALNFVLKEANNGLVAWYRNRWRVETEGSYTQFDSLQAIDDALAALGENSSGEAMRQRAAIAKLVAQTLPDLPRPTLKAIQGFIRLPSTASNLSEVKAEQIRGLLLQVANSWHEQGLETESYELETIAHAIRDAVQADLFDSLDGFTA